MKEFKVIQGGCCFCGQIIAVEVPEDCTTERADEIATEECQCEGAKRYREKKKRKDRANKAIEEQFGDNSRHPLKEEIKEYLKTAADMIVEYRINSVTVDIGRGIKAKIGTTSKANVKVEKIITEKTTEEV